jgi:hypothetical protein
MVRAVREALAAHPHLAQQFEGTFPGFADELTEIWRLTLPAARHSN